MKLFCAISTATDVPAHLEVVAERLLVRAVRAGRHDAHAVVQARQDEAEPLAEVAQHNLDVGVLGDQRTSEGDPRTSSKSPLSIRRIACSWVSRVTAKSVRQDGETHSPTSARAGQGTACRAGRTRRPARAGAGRRALPRQRHNESRRTVQLRDLLPEGAQLGRVEVDVVPRRLGVVGVAIDPAAISEEEVRRTHRQPTKPSCLTAYSSSLAAASPSPLGTVAMPKNRPG